MTIEHQAGCCFPRPGGTGAAGGDPGGGPAYSLQLPTSCPLGTDSTVRTRGWDGSEHGAASRLELIGQAHSSIAAANRLLPERDAKPPATSETTRGHAFVD